MKKRTFRRIRSIALLILIVITITSFINNFNTKEEVYTRHHIYTVVPNDTLWDIAKNFNYYNEDVRQIIHEIKTSNNLKDDPIYPGQVIIIPVRYTVQDSKSIEVVINN